MNDTATTAGNASATASTSSTLDAASILTTAHLIWLAVFAIVVIAGIVYGMRASQRRRHAERQMVEHAREAGVAPAPSAPKPDAPARPMPAPPPAPTVSAEGSDQADGPVSQLKGLGPKVAARLAELGITSVGQIAALDDDAARALDEQLGPFRGRLERDRWVEQARFLAAGDRAGFEAVFGKL